MKIVELLAEKYKYLYNSVPTTESELYEINSTIKNHITNVDVDVTITPHIIETCTKRLKRGKDDGNHGFKSDHIMNGSKKIFLYLSLLFRTMRGYNPSDLLLLTIISIPKDLKGSLSKSDNYRGISLVNSICKLFDYVIVNLYDKQLKTSDMQFGFKSNHSTTMCTAIYMEIINQYKMKDSNVYSCMLDASKAFDRVRFGTLFRLLLKRNLPLGIVRLLLDSYTHQQACTVLDRQKS